VAVAVLCGIVKLASSSNCVCSHQRFLLIHNLESPNNILVKVEMLSIVWMEIFSCRYLTRE
jgi:hypothetical protein